VILLLEEDAGNLPAPLSELLIQEHPKQSAAGAARSVADAVLISSEHMSDPANQPALLGILYSRKVLYVYGVDSLFISRALHLGIPGSRTLSDDIIIGAVYKEGPQWGAGDVQIVRGEEEEVDAALLLDSLREFIHGFRKVVHENMPTLLPDIATESP
jgi:hypothetical protein